MIKLVHNELYKLFHKKMIYILFIIAIGMFCLGMVLDVFLSDSYRVDDMLIPMYEQQLSQLNLDNADDQETYVSLKATIDVANKAKEYNSGYHTPVTYYLYNDYQSTLEDYYRAKIITKDEETINLAQSKLDEAERFIKNYDWKKYIQDKIDVYKMTLQNEEMTRDEKNVINETIKVLKYRIDNNIPISINQGSFDLDSYIAAYTQYSKMNKDDKSYINYSDLRQKKNLEATVEEGKYKLEHKLFKDYETMVAQEIFISDYSLSLFINVCILLIAGSIVAEEYNKGTIKQLLTRPYSRTKIITSKIVATFITIFAFMVALSIVETLIGGICTNSLGTLFDPVVHYSFKTNSIITNNTITEAMINFGALLPCIIVLVLFTIIVSVVTGNTALSIVLGFVLILSPSLFSGLLDRVRLLSYLPMYNWDLSQYLYGGLSSSKYLSLFKAIIVDTVTIIGLIIINILLFKKKDIKNQ